MAMRPSSLANKFLVFALVLNFAHIILVTNACTGFDCLPRKEQKKTWAHHQVKGEDKARRKRIKPDNHNYNAMILAVSKGLDNPYKGLVRTHSENKKMWDRNEGTQHVRELAQTARKSNNILGKIKKLFNSGKTDYRPLERSPRNGSHDPTASLSGSSNDRKAIKCKSSMQGRLNAHVTGFQSPRSRDKVTKWLADIPDDIYTSSKSSLENSPERSKSTHSTHLLSEGRTSSSSFVPVRSPFFNKKGRTSEENTQYNRIVSPVRSKKSSSFSRSLSTGSFADAKKEV